MRRRLRVGGGLFAALALSACVQLPVSGPVVEGPEPSGGSPGGDAVVVPNPPRPGQGPQEIVTSFLEAMRASPIQTSVARRFLSSGAAEEWQPERSTITYADLTSATGARRVGVELVGANHLDGRGAWQGPLPAARAELELPMVREEGEWRIDRAPDALIVPETWFDQHHRRVSLFFFDSAGEVLVPEPVHVPRGEQLATTLTRSLLRGPDEDLAGVARSFAPEGTRLELSVPISDEGTAEVALETPGEVRPEVLEMLVAQLTWTLGQESSVRNIRLMINGEPVSPSGSATVYGVDHAHRYDPAVPSASGGLWGLRDGRVVALAPDEEPAPAGPLGRPGGPRLRSLAVDLAAETVAGVTARGDRVLGAPVGGRGRVRTLARGRDLLAPGWDVAGRLWLVDRGRGSARVGLVGGGERRWLRVPGISGRDVSRFVVSRDGSRLVAVVQGADGDRIVVSRVRHDSRGRVTGATPAEVVARNPEEPLEVSGLDWIDPTTLGVVNRFTDTLSEVQQVPIDGSRALLDQPFTALLRDPVLGFTASPLPGTGQYVTTSEGGIDVSGPDPREVVIDPSVDALTFPG